MDSSAEDEEVDDQYEEDEDTAMKRAKKMNVSDRSPGISKGRTAPSEVKKLKRIDPY